MPVDGYEHKHLWLYRSRWRYPWPLTPLLDPDWDGLDQDWELGLIERLQHGGATHSLPIGDLVRTSHYGGAAEGWEAAEEYSKDAIRSGSAFLNDEAIARRLPERELRKKAYAEVLARWEAEKPQREAEQAQRAAEAAERVKVRREAAQERDRWAAEWELRVAERKAERERNDAEWRQADAERQERQRVEQIVREQVREKEQARYDKLQAAAKQRLKERADILSKQWQCKKCLSTAEISLHLGQYQLICRTCRDRALGDHATLVRMMAA